ncbi:MAG: phosphatidylglycerophosphatase A family protein [Phycisphaerales bacterium]
MATSLGIRLITTFGLGYLRPASGTWGSMPPAIIALGLLLAQAPGWTVILTMAVTVMVFSGACISAGDLAEAKFGGKDPSEVVADETAGMALACLALPLDHASPWSALRWVALAFVLFRIMDIVKPPPAYGLQRVPGGWGILLDDLIAGIYAAVGVLVVRAIT